MEKFDKKSGFTVPDGYFEDAPLRILHAIENAKPVRQSEGFKVPLGYFEHLDEMILQKVENRDRGVIALNPFKKYYYVAAAVAAVLLVYLGLNTGQEKTIVFDFEDLSFYEIEAYFETNELGFTSYEIAEMIPVTDLDINDVLTHQLQEENIIDYLNDNTDSFEELNLENNE